MKNKFLKIAKCASEKDFYAKYKTEEDFFNAHPEAKKMVEKAWGGTTLPNGLQPFDPSNNFQSSWQLPTQNFPASANPWWGNYNPSVPAVPDDALPERGSNTMFPNPSTGIPKQLQGEEWDNAGYKYTDPYKKDKLGSAVEKYAPIAGKLIDGIKQIGEEKKALKKAEQQRMLTDVQSIAAVTKDVDANNMMQRTRTKQMNSMLKPINTNSLFPANGVGTNVIGKNGLILAEDGTSLPYGQMADFANNIFNSANGGPNAGSTIGGSVGEAAGTALGGPIGGAIGKFAGNTIGGLIDTTPKKIKQQQELIKNNQAKIQGAAFANNFQNQNMAYLENGGNAAFNPEFATHWGGDVIPVSYNPHSPGTGLTHNAFGNTHEESDGQGNTGIGLESLNNGGYSGQANVEIENNEPISNNIVYGNLVANLAGKEYKNKKFKNIVLDIAKQENKQNNIKTKATSGIEQNPSITSFDKLALNSQKMMLLGADGNLKKLAEEKLYLGQVQNNINEMAATHGLVADDLAKGKITKDKKVQKEMAKNGKQLYKAVNGVTGPIAPSSSYIQQPNGFLQNFNPNHLINQPLSFKEDGIPGDMSPTDEAHYKELMDLYAKAEAAGSKTKTRAAELLQKKFHEYFPEIAEKIIIDAGELTGRAKTKGYKTFEQLKSAGRTALLDSNVEGWFGKRTKQYIAEMQKKRATSTAFSAPTFTPPVGVKEQTNTPIIQSPVNSVAPTHKSNLLSAIASQLNPLFRQSVKNPLDANQLIGENYALMHSQADPVQANFYNPELITPYDISLQDQLNETTASFNAARRMSGYDPAAQAAISAQEALSKQKILGEQFRINQGQKAQVYNQNIATLNDAELKNLGIMDQQYVRQNQAKSNAEAITQAALSSMSDKIQKNKLETYGMNVYANKFPDYAFNNEGMLRKLPTFYQFDIPKVNDYGDGARRIKGNEDDTPEGFEKITSYKKKTEKPAKNGTVLKAFKNI